MFYTDFEEYLKYCDFISNGIGVRNIGTNGLKLTGEYLERVFTRLGFTTYKQPVEYCDKEGQTHPLFNVISKIEGGEKKIIFCAHYDTVPNCRGGIDNTSGLGVVIELAHTFKRILSTNNALKEKLQQLLNSTTLEFIALTGEEVGEVGSFAYVNSLTDREKQKVIAAYNFDMFMGKIEDNTCLIAHTLGGFIDGDYKEGEEENPIDNVISLAVKKAIKEVEKEEGVMLDIWAPRHYGKSDHVPFHQNKIPSANLTIRGNKSLNGKMPKGYHKKEDVFDVKQFNLKDCKNYLEVVLRSVFLI